MEFYTGVVVTAQVKKSAADDLRVCSEKSPNIAFERDAANSAGAPQLRRWRVLIRRCGLQYCDEYFVAEVFP
jgi:hypothetical protein